MEQAAEITNKTRTYDLGDKRPPALLRKSAFSNYHRSMHQPPTPLCSSFTSLGRWLRCFALALLVWFAAAGSAFAQKNKPPEEEPKGYFLSYTLVVLCLFLGVYCTARPSKRTTELRKETEEE